jgi:PAS domain-containing protein
MEDPSSGGRVQGEDRIGASGSDGSSSPNESSSQLLSMVNLATMSDSQFRESLDALLGDNFSSTTASNSTAVDPVVPIVSLANEAISTNETIPPLPEFPCTTSFGPEIELGPLPDQCATANLGSATLSPTPPSMCYSAPPLVAMMPPPAPMQFLSGPNNTGISNAMVPPMFPQTYMMPQTVGPLNMSAPSSFSQQQHAPLMAPVSSISLPMSSNFPSTSKGLASVEQIPLAQAGPPLPPTVSSSSATTSVATKKRARSRSTAPKEEEPAKNEFRKRRADRNAREQQRAQQVTDQIVLLRKLLEQSGVPLSKTDKFSTLIMVEKYIRSLQLKSAQLAADHQQLLLAMKQTSDHLNTTKASNSKNFVSSSSGSDDASNPSSGQESEEEGLPAVRGINYKWIFDSCPFPVAIASIDGRFMEINKEFEELTGYSRNELLPLERASMKDSKDSSNEESATNSEKKCNMSIFNILHRECIERLFCPMSKILQLYSNDDDDDDQGDDSTCEESGGDKDTIVQVVQLCKRSGRKVRCRFGAVRWRRSTDVMLMSRSSHSIERRRK